MAQATNEVWGALREETNVDVEYKFDINGVTYGKDAEERHSVSNSLFEKFGIGKVSSSTLNLVVEADDIPKNSVIRRYARLVSGDQASDWIPKGVFYLNTRRESDGLWTIEAFDALRKATVKYVQEGDQSEWPLPADVVAAAIADRLEVELDERTTIDPSIMVEYPDDRTIQEVLASIAAAHCGNFIMSDAGKLWLVPLLSAPEETNLLVNQRGDYITFGGVRIIV